MKKVIAGKSYDTETANAIADDEFRDGTNRMSRGRSTTLYKTTKGNFFCLHETCWQGEHDTIEPLTKTQAKEIYESLLNQNLAYTEAFDEIPEEA
jgi:hypothetical protein